MLEGGHEFDGRPLVPFDAQGMRAAARRIRDAGIRSVAIAAVFSPLNASCEEEAAAILREECPDVAVTLSHRLGRIGLLERENAALLNACLIELARTTTRAFTEALRGERHRGAALPHPERRHRHAGRGGGGVSRLLLRLGADQLACAGAAFLSKRDEALVIDVGGTTTDIGSLRHGFPREANNVVEIGGVRTLFRMPDLLSLGLGGGTRSVATAPAAHDRAGQRRAIASPSRRSCSAATSSPSPTSRSPPGSSTSATARAWPRCRPRWSTAALARIHAMIEEGVDRMKTDAGDAPLIAVGGGSFLVPRTPGRRLRGPATCRTRRWPTRWAPPSPRSAARWTRSSRISPATRPSPQARRLAEDKAVGGRRRPRDHQRGGGGGPAARLPARQLAAHPRPRRRRDRAVTGRGSPIAPLRHLVPSPCRAPVYRGQDAPYA